MKKLLLLLPVFLFTGCSLIPSTTSLSTEEISWSALNTSTFTVANIELVDGQSIYKNVIPYRDGYIWVLIGWQDWYEIDLIYSETWNIIKKSMPIFWYDVGYTYKNIYEYCLPYGVDNTSDQWTRPEIHSLDQCPLITSLSVCLEWIDHSLPNDCLWGQIALAYMYDLIQWNTNNSYFSQKLQAFKDSL